MFALDNFCAHIISLILTSVPEAMSLQIDSNLRRYWVDSIYYNGEVGRVGIAGPVISGIASIAAPPMDGKTASMT